MAKRRRGRPVNGILVLNKPTGLSSNQALQKARWLFQAQKAGHTGSLDPLATGVLPICFGEATKFSQFLLDSDKAYRSTFCLGVTTTTGDSEGDVIDSQPSVAVTEAGISEILPQFRGEIEQVPSMYSALKHQGQPLYKLARQGLEVERKARRVTIYELELEAYRDATGSSAKPEIDVLVRCSKGTYVRSLAEDIGRVLGCGAHVTRLHRIGAGPFDETQMVSLEQLQGLKDAGQFALMDDLLLPADLAVRQFPAVTLVESSAYYMLQGQAVVVPRAPTHGLVRMYSESEQFLGMGEVLDDGRIGPKRLIATQ